MKSTRMLHFRQLLQSLNVTHQHFCQNSDVHIRSMVIDVLNAALRVILARNIRTVISE